MLTCCLQEDPLRGEHQQKPNMIHRMNNFELIYHTIRLTINLDKTASLKSTTHQCQKQSQMENQKFDFRQGNFKHVTCDELQYCNIPQH